MSSTQALDYKEVVKDYVKKLQDTAEILQKQLDAQAFDSPWFKSIGSSRLVVKGSRIMDEYLESVRKVETMSTHTWPKTARERRTSPYTLSHRHPSQLLTTTGSRGCFAHRWHTHGLLTLGEQLNVTTNSFCGHPEPVHAHDLRYDGTPIH